jgi:hypothetical protein
MTAPPLPGVLASQVPLPDHHGYLAVIGQRTGTIRTEIARYWIVTR